MLRFYKFILTTFDPDVMAEMGGHDVPIDNARAWTWVDNLLDRA